MRHGSVLRAVACTLYLSGCEPDLVAGTRECFADRDPASAADPGRVTDALVQMPWSTGFEDGFCGYAYAGGYCFVNTEAAHALVEAPVHSGKFAAAFSVHGNDSKDALGSRCVRQGELPKAAYYGAWYFIPSLARNTGGWNLFHFEGWDGTPEQHGMWDVSVASSANELSLYLFEFSEPLGVTHLPDVQRPLPIGEWVHIELFLRRAADRTGRVTLYQDGEQIIDLNNVVTDTWTRGEWYVGNFADGLMPPESTLYVDDVTIRATR